jgi:hypothetical protein
MAAVNSSRINTSVVIAVLAFPGDVTRDSLNDVSWFVELCLRCAKEAC